VALCIELICCVVTGGVMYCVDMLCVVTGGVMYCVDMLCSDRWCYVLC
jgi:hypothetical protein